MKKSILLSVSVAAAGLMAGSLSAGLLTNPGFETGDLTGYTVAVGSATVVLTPKNSGEYSAYLDFDGGTNAIYQEFAASQGQVWDFSGYALVDHDAIDIDTALLKIVFTDGTNDLAVTDILIGSADPSVVFPGIRSDPVLNSSNTATTGWDLLQARGRAPAGTTNVRFFVITVASGQNPTKGAYFDDLNASLVVPEPSVLIGALTALSLGGFLLRRRR